MSNLLYRLGRSAATRPWVAIGAWVVLALVVIASSVAFGRDLEESFEAPGLDSYQAAELLAEAQADEGGVTAHVVLEAQDAAAQLAPVEAALEGLPHVLSTTSSVSPDGDIALVRVQYPAIEHLDAVRPGQPQGRRRRPARRVVADAGDRRRSVLRVRGSTHRARRGRGDRRRDDRPADRLRLLRRDGAADRDGAVRSGHRRHLDEAGDLPDRHPGVGAAARGHGRARRRYRLRALPGHPAPRAPGPGDAGRRSGRPSPGDSRTGGDLRRRHGRRGDPRVARRGDPVRDRWWGRHLRDGARDGARLGHLAAGTSRAGGAPDQRTPAHARTGRAPAGTGGALT